MVQAATSKTWVLACGGLFVRCSPAPADYICSTFVVRKTTSATYRTGCEGFSDNPKPNLKERHLNHRISTGLLALCLTVFTLPGVVAAKNSRPFKAQGQAVWDNIFNGLVNPPANFTGTI